MKQTAFITGASGFIGINLVKQLCEEGWDVTALHRKQSNITHLSKFPVKLVEGDIYKNNIDSLVPKHTDSLFHVAANTNFNRVPDVQQDLDTINGTVNMGHKMEFPLTKILYLML